MDMDNFKIIDIVYLLNWYVYLLQAVYYMVYFMEDVMDSFLFRVPTQGKEMIN